MSTPGRPKGEYRSAQREVTPLSTPGRRPVELRGAGLAAASMGGETPVLFGPRRDLVGIENVPAGGPGSVGCLLFNAGVLHRVGPHRLNVKVARALAAQGMASIRFDLSGVGDSPASHSGAPGAEQSVSDMQAAMEHLGASAGVDKFIVIGICSGAVNGYLLALKDPRVVGLLMFDGFIFQTFKTRLVRRWLLFRSLPWGTLLRRTPAMIRRIVFGKQAPPATLFGADGATGNPPKGQFRSAMDELTARGVSAYLIYSGSFRLDYNYRAQLQDAFRGAAFLGRIRYDFMPDVDHTLTSVASQRKLTAAVCEWAASLNAT